jgi:hypothetical protein
LHYWTKALQTATPQTNQFPPRKMMFEEGQPAAEGRNVFWNSEIQFWHQKEKKPRLFVRLPQGSIF